MSMNEFNDFTLFDVFLKNELITIVCSINNNPVNENEIDIYVNNTKLQYSHKYMKTTGEPCLILFYICVEKTEEVTINYKKIERVFPIDNIDTNRKGTLALTTLCKNDYSYFPTFYDYYTKQGVEHFYIYYNGKLHDNVNKVMNYPNVTLIEWNFRYWNKGQYKCKYKHHAQPCQINHALYKYGKQNYDYMIFNDLDEYFHIEGYSLKDYIKNNPSINIFGFRNIWARTITPGIPSTIPNEFLCSNVIWKYSRRAKNIYKTDDIKLAGIHSPHIVEKQKNRIVDLNMYHFLEWNHKRCFESLWTKIYIKY